MSILQQHMDIKLINHFEKIHDEAFVYHNFLSQQELKEVIDENEMITALQSQVGNNRVRFRVQFNEQASDGDGVADMIRFSDHVHLLITYIP